MFLNENEFERLDMLSGSRKEGYFRIDTKECWDKMESGNVSWNPREYNVGVSSNVKNDIMAMFASLMCSFKGPKDIYSELTKQKYKDAEGYQAYEVYANCIFTLRAYDGQRDKLFINCYAI